MRERPTNFDDVIDSRDVIEAIEELATLVADGEASEEEIEELETLRALAKQGEDYAPDWSYGETLIRDSYFQTYAQEMAEDLGAVDPNAAWPHNCIDWERAARELQMDYSAIEFDGVTYWVR